MTAFERGIGSLALALCVACGKSTHGHNDSPVAEEGGASTDGSESQRPVVHFEGTLPESCDTSELRITYGGTREVFDIAHHEQLIWKTSWDSSYIGAQTLPVADGGLLAGWAEGSASFEEGEVRSLDRTLVLLPRAPAQLYCAGGDSQVIASAGKGYVILTDLSALACGDKVEGSLTYCSSCDDPTYDSYMLHGRLEARELRLVTGEKDYRDSLIVLRIGHSFLVATTTRGDSGGLAIEKGAFLDLATGELYCIGALEGMLEEGAIGEVTFSEFRRALACEPDPEGPQVEGCFERDQGP